MSLEKSSIVWSAKQIRGMVANGKIKFEHIVQRGLAWEKTRKTGLIESMILGYPVPMIYAKRVMGVLLSVEIIPISFLTASRD